MTPYTKFLANWMKNKEVQIFYYFPPQQSPGTEPKIQDDVMKTL